MSAEQHKIKQRADRLYDQYAKPLEDEHRGKYIAVSPSGQVVMGDSAVGETSWILADGSEVFAPYYLGTVQLGDVGSYPALVATLGDEPLIGRGITDRVRLILDHGERVIVEP